MTHNEIIFARRLTKQLTSAAITVLVFSIVFGRDAPFTRWSAILLVFAWFAYFLSALLGAVEWFRLNSILPEEPSGLSDASTTPAVDEQPLYTPMITKVQAFLFILATGLLLLFGIFSVLRPGNGQDVTSYGPNQGRSLECRILRECFSQKDFDVFVGYLSTKLNPTLKTEIQNTFKTELKVVLESQLDLKTEISLMRKTVEQRCSCCPPAPATRSSHHARATVKKSCAG